MTCSLPKSSLDDGGFRGKRKSASTASIGALAPIFLVQTAATEQSESYNSTTNSVITLVQ